jgi:hypothetical protein
MKHEAFPCLLKCQIYFVVCLNPETFCVCNKYELLQTVLTSSSQNTKYFKIPSVHFVVHFGLPIGW